jgi:hypothetical protein
MSKHYVLIAYEYEDGSSSGEPVKDERIAQAIGELLGLGNPTDSVGWGIWDIGSLTVPKPVSG